MSKLEERRLAVRPWVQPTSQEFARLRKPSCWHFDAFAYSRDGHAYVVIETRRGGDRLLDRRWYMAVGAGLYPTVQPAVTFSRWLLDERLNAMHWQYVVPWSKRPPQWAKSTSVLCHYVRRSDDDHAIENYFDVRD